MNGTQMAVYKLHKLARTNGGFDRAIRIALERDVHVVQIEYAEQINSFSNINGLYYEKDEKATKLWLDKKPFKEVKEYVEFIEVKEEEIVLPKIKDTTKSIEEESMPKTRDELAKLYEKKSGNKAKAIWGINKLTQELELLKQ